MSRDALRALMLRAQPERSLDVPFRLQTVVDLVV